MGIQAKFIRFKNLSENNLKTFCLAFSIIGLLSLIYWSKNLEIKKYEIEEIYNGSIELGTRIKICGEIEDLKDKKNLIIINLKDNTGEISIVIFKNRFKDYSPLTKEHICVIGRLSEYKGNPEIIAERLL